MTPIEAFKVSGLAHETGFVVALVYSHFKCRSVGRLSGSITFTPKVGVDNIGSGWERQDESWSKSHHGSGFKSLLERGCFGRGVNQISEFTYDPRSDIINRG